MRLLHNSVELRQFVEEQHPLMGERVTPGRARMPPPTNAGSEAEWCGSRNGRSRVSPLPRSPPATDWIMPSSKASAGSSGGNNPGRRAASIDLPDPGGPTISRL